MLVHDDGAVAHAGQLQQPVLDLAHLDSEARDLDLTVPASEELEPATGNRAAVVTAAIDALSRLERIGPERRPRAFGVVDVAAPHADTREDDFA